MHIQCSIAGSTFATSPTPNDDPIANERCFSQVRYAAQEISEAKSARARGSYLRVSFKNTRETAQAVNGMKLSKALTFLENVTKKTMAVPMRRYAGSTGRTAQGESPLLKKIFGWIGVLDCGGTNSIANIRQLLRYGMK